MMRSKLVAAVALTVLTIAVIGVVLLTLTPIGCGPSNALGMKSNSNRCAKPVAAQSPYPSAKPGQSPQYSSPGITPYSPPASSPYNPPYSPPASGPYYPPASGPFFPDGRPASSAYPPFVPPTSSGGFNPGLSLNCRLPVYVGQSGSGGFIVFPGGSFIADPASAVSLPAGAPSPSPPMMGPGYGQGYSGLSYDRAFSKWLPVPMSWVAPDGSKYAFGSSNSIWVQNVADGTHVLLGEGQPWAIVAFLSEGVYASAPTSAGLWLLPLSGAPRQVATTGYWRAAAAGNAYGTATSAVPQGASNGIVKLDLKTGAITDWFARGNSQASVLGFDAQGHPVIQLNYQAPYNGSEIWLTTGPSSGTPLAGSGSGYYYGLQLVGTPVGDSHGIWFQAYYPSSNGMVLYVPGSNMYWMSNISAQLAGGCS
jgi:hypothetical protein